MREAKAWVRKSHKTKDQPRSRQRWEVIYEDPKHPTKKPFSQRTKGGFTSEKAANDWASEHRASTRRGEYIGANAGKVTFADVASAWFAAQHFDRRHTANGYRRIIEGNNDLTRTFNAVEVADIAPAMVQHFIRDASTRLAPQTVRHQFYVLRMVLDHAVEADMLLVNPARRLSKTRLPEPARLKERRRHHHRLTPAQVKALVKAMPEPYDMFTLLLSGTGMRPEEATGLTLADVDTSAETVHVHQVIVEVNGEVVREEVTKTPESNRVIELDPYVGAQLTRYITQHRKRAAKWFSDHPEHEHPGEALPLFVGTVVGGRTSDPVLKRLDYSKPMRYGAFYKRYWSRARDAAGLPKVVRMYDLRHTHASLCLDAGMTIKEVQERLGHSSAHMTMDVYWHSDSDDEARKRRRAQVAAAYQRAEPAPNVTPINTKRGKAV